MAKLLEELHECFRARLHLGLLHNLAGCLDNAHAREFQRHVNCGIVIHGLSPKKVCRCLGPDAQHLGTPFTITYRETATFLLSWRWCPGPLRHLARCIRWS